MHFILVHGTFARNAPWTRPGSDFRRRLAEAAGGTCTFDVVTWSGRNTRRARLQAAEQISEAVQLGASQVPEQSLFLIGHSHGGSAIARFLARGGSLSGRVSGAAFLSSPFYAVRAHEPSIRLIPMLEAAVLLIWLPILATLYLEPAYLAARSMGDLEEAFRGDPSALGAISILFPVLVTMVLGIIVFISRRMTLNDSGLDALIRRDLGRERRDLETCDLPEGPFLFARASGDEVAGGFTFAIFLQRSVRLLWQVFGVALRVAFSPLTITSRSVVLRVMIRTLVGGGCVVLAAAFVLWTSALADNVKGDPVRLVLNSIVVPWIMAAHLETASEIWPIAIPAVVAAAAGSLLLTTTLVIPVLVLLGAAIGALIGGMSPLLVLFGEVSVEPVPYGRRSFIHVRWNEDSEHSSRAIGANHGHVYGSPVVAELIGSWASSIAADAKTQTHFRAS